MKCFVQTKDRKWWVAGGGFSLTKIKRERAIFETKKLAQFYIDGTNVFGGLCVVPSLKK